MIVSTTQAAFLKSNANRMSVKEMAGALNVSVSKVYEWLKELKIERNRKAGNRKAEPVAVKKGMFNPDAYGDYITGFKRPQYH